MAEEPTILGVYSLTRTAEAGIGSTAKEFVQKTYWFARRLSDEEFEVQPLNDNHVPSGITTLLTKGAFMQGYEPEVEYYESKTLPHMRSLKDKIERGESFFQEGNFTKAEEQFIKALLIDKANARANLGLGAVYCETSNYAKLKKIIDGLVVNTDTFKKELSQQFNRFAVSLRKAKQYDEAIIFYDKAITVNQRDENLFFNTARAYYEKGDLTESIRYLEQAVAIRPDFAEAHKFIRYCVKQLGGPVPTRVPPPEDDLALPDIVLK